MRVARQWSLDGEEINNSDTYRLVDNTELNNLVVSTTTLYHEDQEEVYMFTRGEGYINLDGEEFAAKEGDVFTIKAKVFHQVRNPHPEFALHFMCVFEGKRNH